MPAFPTRSTQRQRGFSLLEVMVGAAIALIGIVVIFQVLSVWEGRKRTTSSGSDAQVAGAIAMFSLERDLKVAGYGFGMSTYMGCNVLAYDATPFAARPTAFPFMLAPVQILDGGPGGAPDQLWVAYGNSSFYVSNQTILPPAAGPATPTSKRLQGSRASFQKGELAIVAGNTPAECALVEITGNANPDGLSLDHVNGAYINYLGQNVTSRFNDPAGTGATFANGGVMHNMGSDPRLNAWRIQAAAGGTVPRVLAVSDFLHSPDTWSEVAEGIVDLQAEYGVDSNNDNMITSTGPNEWTVAAPANWNQVRAVRVALLARSQQFEKAPVYTTPGCTVAGCNNCTGAACTPPAPSWAGGDFTMTNTDGTADSSAGDATDWRHYRYRVYQQVVPLRNMIWGTAP